MGKLKKPAKNSYFFFIMEEKERNRFNGSFNEASQRYGHKWKQLTKEGKIPYEEMAKRAKENEKYDMNNKFTVTGETYAAVHQKRLEDQAANDRMEAFIEQLVSSPSSGDRNFIFVKIVHSVEEIVDRRTKVYWPSELSMVAFSMKGGIKAIYTQLIDTLRTPTGYASQAKEVSEETMLPMPGDGKRFKREDSDYVAILKRINGFANHYLKDGYNVPGHRKVFFGIEGECEPVVSSIQWLVDQLPNGEPRGKYQYFVDNLKVYRTSRLVLALATEANRANPDYSNYLVDMKLDSAADAIVTKGNYDYREEIACEYHRSDYASVKLHNCAQSIAMRRAFMIFEEFLPAFKYTQLDRHDINKLGPIRGPVTKRPRRSPTPELPETKEYTKCDVEPDWLKCESGDVSENEPETKQETEKDEKTVICVKTNDNDKSSISPASKLNTSRSSSSSIDDRKRKETGDEMEVDVEDQEDYHRTPVKVMKVTPKTSPDLADTFEEACRKIRPEVDTFDYSALPATATSWAPSTTAAAGLRSEDFPTLGGDVDSSSSDPFPSSWNAPRQARAASVHSPPSRNEPTGYPAGWSSGHSDRSTRGFEPPRASHSPPTHQNHHAPAGYPAWASSGPRRGFEAPVQRTFLENTEDEFPSLSSAGRGRGRRN